MGPDPGQAFGGFGAFNLWENANGFAAMQVGQDKMWRKRGSWDDILGFEWVGSISSLRFKLEPTCTHALGVFEIAPRVC